MPRTWRYAAFDEAYVRQLCSELRVSPLIAQVLCARGCTSGLEARSFLARRLNDLHDPELLPGVSNAADRIVAAIQGKRRITIYGDYDVDGVTATSLLHHCVKLAGGHVEYYIPSRCDEGYGLNCDAIRTLAENDQRQLVVTVDCGITSAREAALAQQLGLELIITDHHQFDGELPDAPVLVHPRLPGGSYPFGDLCGAGVAFKLAWAVCARLGDGKKASPAMREFLLQAVGLAAVGTIADVVPLVGENRVIVHYGLSSLLDRASPGLRALLKIAGALEKPKLDPEDIGFHVGPRINAAGRLGQARLAVELLTTEDPARAASLAQYVDGLNKDRQTVERRMLKQAKEQVEATPAWLDQHGLVLAHPEWHPGVIGIVAGRVAEYFDRPAVMIAMNGATNLGQGSARSSRGVDLHAALSACREHLVQFGGHRAAAGLKISVDAIESFREAFHQAVGDVGRDAPLETELSVDAEVRLDDVTLKAMNELDLIAPFGQGNPRPLFAASGVRLAGPPKTMGEGDRHLSLQVRQGSRSFRAVAFGRGEWAGEIAQAGQDLSICFRPSINRYRGQESVEFQLVDWKPGSSTTSMNSWESLTPIAT